MNGDRILLVEDDREIREGVEIFLENQGYVVFQAINGVKGPKVLEERETDLVIVDVMIPRMDDITMTAKLHEKYGSPAIFLSAESEEMDKILGLNMGADDYITKPFIPVGLMARVNSQLRYYHRFPDRSDSKQTGDPEVHRLGGLEVNEEAIEVTVDDKTVKVTPIGFETLLLLMQSPGRVLPAEGIYERMQNERAVDTDTVMVHICNLREKIEASPREPKYVEVMWGVGYKIEKQP